MTRASGRTIQLLSLSLLLLVASVSCRPRVRTTSLGEVIIPDHLTSPRERQSYLIDHYWDREEAQPTTSDSLLVHKVKDFCGLIQGAPTTQVRRSLLRSLEAFGDEGLPLALSTYRDQLFRPESPLYDERLYSFILDWERRSMKVDSARRVEALLSLVRLQHNRVGSTAKDFRFYASDTSLMKLSEVKAPYTLLFLQVDSDRKELLWASELKASKSLQALIQKRALQPLMIYTGQARPDSLQRSLFTGAILAPDSAGLIATQRRYDLSRGSVLYLLDQKKTVLLRNTSIPKVASYLDIYEKQTSPDRTP